MSSILCSRRMKPSFKPLSSCKCICVFECVRTFLFVSFLISCQKVGSIDVSVDAPILRHSSSNAFTFFDAMQWHIHLSVCYSLSKYIHDKHTHTWRTQASSVLLAWELASAALARSMALSLSPSSSFTASVKCWASLCCQAKKGVHELLGKVASS